MRRNAVLRAGLLGLATVSVVWAGLCLPRPTGIFRRSARDPGGPTGRTVSIEGVEFVEIGPGSFRMGSRERYDPGDVPGRTTRALRLGWGRPAHSNEMPEHVVTFRRSYFLARTEVTNAQYERFDPSHERTFGSSHDRSPVVEVSWDDAKAYCRWLAERSGRPVRLPSEAEWENACRAGRAGPDEPHSRRRESVWFRSNSGWIAREVATRAPNPWGFYDLRGNVWEWCEDAYFPDYRGAPTDGSARTVGAPRGRAVRGGGNQSFDEDCRFARRMGWAAGVRGSQFGFRPAFTSPDR